MGAFNCGLKVFTRKQEENLGGRKRNVKHENKENGNATKINMSCNEQETLSILCSYLLSHLDSTSCSNGGESRRGRSIYFGRSKKYSREVSVLSLNVRAYLHPISMETHCLHLHSWVYFLL